MDNDTTPRNGLGVPLDYYSYSPQPPINNSVDAVIERLVDRTVARAIAQRINANPYFQPEPDMLATIREVQYANNLTRVHLMEHIRALEETVTALRIEVRGKKRGAWWLP